MSESEDDSWNDDEYDDQIEQVIMENGMMIHSVINLLVRKGVIKQEEIDTEMEKLNEEMESAQERD